MWRFPEPWRDECTPEAKIAASAAPSPSPSLPELTKAASVIFGLTVDGLMRPNRTERYSRVRWAIMYIARTDKRMTYEAMGRHFFGMDHSSIIYGVRRMRGLLHDDPAYAAKLAGVRELASRLAQIRSDRDLANARTICARAAE